MIPTLRRSQILEILQASGLERLPGLDPDKLYTDEETGHVYSGALLMHGGLDLSANDFSSHDGEALVKHFVAKA